MMDKEVLAIVPMDGFKDGGTLTFYLDGTYTWTNRELPTTYPTLSRWRISGRMMYINHSNHSNPLDGWINARKVDGPSYETNNRLIDQIIDAIEAELEVRKMLSLGD